MPISHTAAIEDLKQALAIAEEIQRLEVELAALLTGGSMPPASAAPSASVATKRGKRRMSPATIAKMRASQQARWAKKRGAASQVEATPEPTAKRAKKKRKLSPEGRARIVAALKKRWAAAKK